MASVYTAEYLKTHEVKEKVFKNKEEALKFKKKLKKQGFTVTWKKWNFADLARANAYVVKGVRRRYSALGGKR